MAPAEQVERPAVAVRISNSPDAPPPTGLGSADVVIETLVEGGLTRFVAIFHCSTAATAAPVRSARLQDAELVRSFAGLLAFSGSNEAVWWELAASGIKLVAEVTPGDEVFREPADSLDVDSVHADLVALRRLGGTFGLSEPGPAFRFGDLQSPNALASSVTMHFGETLVSFRWSKGFWRRFQNGRPFLDASGRQVTARNVIVQEVDATASTTLLDALGAPSPSFDLAGPGRALLFRDRRVIEGTWAREGPCGPTFRTAGGALLSLARGRTWIEMVPSQAGDLRGTIAYPR